MNNDIVSLLTLRSDCNAHTHTHTHTLRVTLAGPAVVHQSVSSMTGALDQSSDHLTLLGAASVILVTVALTGAWTCTPHGNITGT